MGQVPRGLSLTVRTALTAGTRRGHGIDAKKSRTVHFPAGRLHAVHVTVAALAAAGGCPVLPGFDDRPVLHGAARG